MPTLKNNPTVSNLQTYVNELEVERGFTQDQAIHKCLMLGEEIGELFEVLLSQPLNAHNIGNEMADIVIYALSIANRLNVEMHTSLANLAVKQNKALDSAECTNTTFHGFQKMFAFDDTKNNLPHLALLFGTAFGKLCKIIRKTSKLKIDTNSQIATADEALASLLAILYRIANLCSVDLEQSFRNKEEINKNRVWQLAQKTA